MAFSFHNVLPFTKEWQGKDTKFSDYSINFVFEVYFEERPGFFSLLVDAVVAFGLTIDIQGDIEVILFLIEKAFHMETILQHDGMVLNVFAIFQEQPCHGISERNREPEALDGSMEDVLIHLDT